MVRPLISICWSGAKIENTRQLVGLSELGCGAGQGYYFSRPLSGADVVRWLLERLAS